MIYVYKVNNYKIYDMICVNEKQYYRAAVAQMGPRAAVAQMGPRAAVAQMGPRAAVVHYSEVYKRVIFL